MLGNARFLFRESSHVSDPLLPEPQSIKPPSNASVLISRINNYARSNKLDIPRVQQRVRTELMVGVLDRAEEQRAIPGYLVKGGMALELRFGMRARASADLDVAIQGDDILELLDDALAVGFDEFTFERRKTTKYLENAKTHRIQVKISFKNRPIGTIDIDINQAMAETATETTTTSILTQFGLPGPLRVPIIDAHTHLAHKLHAATELSRIDYKNQRFRDIIDALVLARQGNIDFDSLQSIVLVEFGQREYNRVWPPIWSLPAEWRGPIETLAKAQNFEPTDPTLIEREFIALMARIEGVQVKPTHEYRLLGLQIRMSGGGGQLAGEAQQQFDELIADGWQVVLWAQHRAYVDQLQVVLERKLPSADDLPRLQLRVQTETTPTQQIYLTGNLRNESDRAANKVRVFAGNVDEVIRLGTVTRGDGDVRVSLRYDHQPLHNGFTQFPSLWVQYLTDDGERVAQISVLRSNGADAGGHTYTGEGLGPPERIEKFTVPHDIGEIL